MSEPTWTGHLDAMADAHPDMAAFLGFLRPATQRMDAAGSPAEVPIVDEPAPLAQVGPGGYWRRCPHCTHLTTSAYAPPTMAESDHYCRRGDRIVFVRWWTR